MAYICVDNHGATRSPVGRRFVWYDEHDQESWREAVGRALQTISGGHDALTLRRTEASDSAVDGMQAPTWWIEPVAAPHR